MSLKSIYNSIFLAFLFFSLINLSCNRGTGCPAEEAKVRTDKNGNPKSKPKSGLFDSKGRMNSKGHKVDKRKSKKSKDYKN